MRRKRLTITLDPRTLSQIDSYINGQTIRNRSHAIEYLVKKVLPPNVTKAVILAGGSGLRFRPLTYEIPNAMIPFRGKPLLDYLIKLIKETGITEVVICVGHLADKIIKRFGDGSNWDVKITYSYDGPKSLGTAGALLKAKKHLKNGPFLVIHGDVLSNIDVQDMIGFHDGKKYLATLALTTVDDPRRCGVVRVKGIDLVEYDEKPLRKKHKSNLIHAGIYILEPEAFDYFPRKKKASMENDVFPKLANEGKIAAYLFEGQWFDISYPKYYEKALKSFKFTYN
jgi:NDP-sugar pyrophosphorylase family protein